MSRLPMFLLFSGLLGSIVALNVSLNMKAKQSRLGMKDVEVEKAEALEEAKRYLMKVRQPIAEIISQIQREEITKIESYWTNASYKTRNF